MLLHKAPSIIYLISAVLIVCNVYCADQCYTCDGQSCLRTSHSTTFVTCPANDYCVTLFNKFQPIRKDCYSNLSDDDKFICDSDDNVNCYKCSLNNCNNRARIDNKCAQCSSENDFNCLNNVDNTENRCMAPKTDNAYCYTQIVNEQLTKRGCITNYAELKNCFSNPLGCAICVVTKYGACNKNEFPVGRRKCISTEYTCRNDTSCINNNANNSNYCNNIVDQCFTLNNYGHVKHSCMERMTIDDIQFCTQHPSSCVYCQTNNCNLEIPSVPNDANHLTRLFIYHFNPLLFMIIILLSLNNN